MAVPKKIWDLLYKQGELAAFPSNTPHMLALLVDKPVTDPAYIYEVKWDGYRISAYCTGKNVALKTRSHLDYSSKYPPIVAALTEAKYYAVFDGEVVVLDEKGKPDFDALQKYNGSENIAYYVFDILWLDGYSTLNMPLVNRRKILEAVLKPNDIIRLSGTFDDGLALFEQVKKIGLEGMIAKKRDSKYKPGDRKGDWLKIKTDIRQEYVIGGWTESEGGRQFRSLLFGYYNEGKLYYLGHSGGGYKEKDFPEILKKLKPLEIKTKPFVNEVETDTSVHWVKPVLVANFKFDTFTSSGKIRKPAIFLGLRDDKDPKDVQYEIPVSKAISRKNKPAAKGAATTDDSNWPVLEKVDITSSGTVTIEGHEVELTNVEREIWPGFTKAELIKYYHSIAPFVLPYLQERPLSLHVKNINARAPGLYIKDMEGREPPYAGIFRDKRKHPKKGKRDIIDYIVCQNEATLLYLINLGCIDLNPWSSRIKNPTQPDYIGIDLDPTIKDASDPDFFKPIEAAMATKEFCDRHKLKAFCKTSGKTGMHFYIPCAGFDFAQARKLAEHICREVHLMIPEITTIQPRIADRGDKLYMDPSQNDYADTLAAPYSARPWAHKTVSTPVEWKEIDHKLDPMAFTIDTIHKRLEKKGDLFEGLLDAKYRAANSRILKQFI